MPERFLPMPARRYVVVLACVALLTLASCGGSGRKSLRPSEHPNIVFVLTDDLDLAEMRYMPNVHRLLAEQGVTFTHYFVSNSLCCPSRSSILRGQYAHNTGVQTNGAQNGGFETAYRLGIEKSTIATWLHDAGYRTAYIGKYLNQYPDTAKPTYVPPGWDEFDSAAAGNPYSEYEYQLNENGHLKLYGAKPRDYGTFVYLNKAERFMKAAAGKSYFLYLNVYPPHQPATPAPQDRDLFPNAQAPRIPSFNRIEAGKPAWLSQRRPLGPAAIDGIDALHRDRIRSLQAVDRGVGQLIDTLKATGQLANTYFIFSSDNGFHLGEFGLPAGKGAPYDSDIRVPLVVRGPGHRSRANPRRDRARADRSFRRRPILRVPPTLPGRRCAFAPLVPARTLAGFELDERPSGRGTERTTRPRHQVQGERVSARTPRPHSRVSRRTNRPLPVCRVLAHQSRVVRDRH